MYKQKTLAFGLILIMGIFLLLPGCKPKNAPSKSLVNKNIPSSQRRVDVFMDSYSQARLWGIRQVRVYIL